MKNFIVTLILTLSFLTVVNAQNFSNTFDKKFELLPSKSGKLTTGLKQNWVISQMEDKEKVDQDTCVVSVKRLRIGTEEFTYLKGKNYEYLILAEGTVTKDGEMDPGTTRYTSLQISGKGGMHWKTMGKYAPRASLVSSYNKEKSKFVIKFNNAIASIH